MLEEGANGVGPYLHGVVGREVAAAEGYGYSGSLKPVADVWTPQELDAFLENPAGYAPGTTMGFSGLGDIEDRANVIAYLDETDGDTYEIDMPAAEDAAAADAGDAATDGDSEVGADEAAAEGETQMAGTEGAADGTGDAAIDRRRGWRFGVRADGRGRGPCRGREHLPALCGLSQGRGRGERRRAAPV